MVRSCEEASSSSVLFESRTEYADMDFYEVSVCLSFSKTFGDTGTKSCQTLLITGGRLKNELCVNQRTYQDMPLT